MDNFWVKFAHPYSSKLSAILFFSNTQLFLLLVCYSFSDSFADSFASSSCNSWCLPQTLKSPVLHKETFIQYTTPLVPYLHLHFQFPVRHWTSVSSNSLSSKLNIIPWPIFPLQLPCFLVTIPTLPSHFSPCPLKYTLVIFYSSLVLHPNYHQISDIFLKNIFISPSQVTFILATYFQPKPLSPNPRLVFP